MNFFNEQYLSGHWGRSIVVVSSGGGGSCGNDCVVEVGDGTADPDDVGVGAGPSASGTTSGCRGR